MYCDRVQKEADHVVAAVQNKVPWVQVMPRGQFATEPRNASWENDIDNDPAQKDFSEMWKKLHQ